MRSSRGFTLIESVFVVLIVAIMGSITAWQMTVMLPRSRTTSAANKLVLDVRKASALAARMNRPVTLEMNPAGCTPGYLLTQGGTIYERVCYEQEYAGVEFKLTNKAEIECESEKEAGFTAISACSLCDGKSEIRFLPNGEVQTPSSADESVVIGPVGEDGPFDLAVGIRNLTGRARAYKRSGAGWVCL